MINMIVRVLNLEKVVSILSWRKLFVHDGIVLKAMSGNLKCSFNYLGFSRSRRFCLLVPFAVTKVESTDLSLLLNLKMKSILGLASEMGSLRAAGSAFQYGSTAAFKTVCALSSQPRTRGVVFSKFMFHVYLPGVVSS